MVCATCGTENAGAAESRIGCGAALLRVRGACGTTNPPSARFCSEWGERRRPLIARALDLALEHDKPSAALRAYCNLFDSSLRLDRAQRRSRSRRARVLSQPRTSRIFPTLPPAVKRS